MKTCMWLAQASSPELRAAYLHKGWALCFWEGNALTIHCPPTPTMFVQPLCVNPAGKTGWNYIIMNAKLFIMM